MEERFRKTEKMSIISAELLRSRRKGKPRICKLIVNLRKFRHLYLKGENPSFRKYFRGLETFLLDLIWRDGKDEERT